jgi:hypothetical protein
MGSNSGTIKLEDITQEQIEKFYEFLQGEVPDDLRMKRPPHLSEQMAFRIIYYLQEEFEILPDIYERCKTCGCIYNSENEGNDLHCDYCRKD